MTRAARMQLEKLQDQKPRGVARLLRQGFLQKNQRREIFVTTPTSGTTPS